MVNAKNKKTAVFIDYESWYYGLVNLYNEKPDVRGLLGEIEHNNDVVIKKCFGNLPVVGGIQETEKNKLKEFSYELEYTYEGNMKESLTDFVVVDHIYRMLINDTKREIEKLIIISGDAHYLQVLRTVRDFNIEVVVIGVKGTISSVFEEFNVKTIQPKSVSKIRSAIEEEMYLIESLTLTTTPKKLALRIKNKYSEIDLHDVEKEIDLMMKEGYLKQKEILTFKNKLIKSLSRTN